jgi:hypothetical protein
LVAFRAQRCRSLREPTCPAQGRKTKKYPPQRLSLITSRATGAVGGDGLTTQELHQVRRYISQGKGELVGSAVVGQAATSSKAHAVVSEAGLLTRFPNLPDTTNLPDTYSPVPSRNTPMPIKLTDDETAELVNLLVGVIEHDPFPLSARIQRLRRILTKIRPMPELPPDEPDDIDDEPEVL